MSETLINYSSPVHVRFTMVEKEVQKQKNAAIEAIFEIRKKQKPISRATLIKALSQIRS